MTTDILAFDPERRTNGQLIAKCAKLGYLLEPVVDPTYGEGGMWTEYQPVTLYASDLDPALQDCDLEDLRDLPHPDQSVGSVVLDIPYKLGGTPTKEGGDGAMNERFGIDRYRSPADVKELLAAGMTEAARVTRRGGYVLVKLMDQTNSGRLHLQSAWSLDIAAGLPLRLVDRLHTRHTPRPQRSQVTARNNFSSMMVYKRLKR